MVETVLNNGGFMHGFTYAGNPMACAAGCVVLDVIDDENLVDNSAVQGEYLLGKMHALGERYPWIGDVRGKGLLMAVEFADKQTKEPLPNDWNVSLTMTGIGYDNGLLIYPRKSLNGVKGDHVLVAPPLTITRDECDQLLLLLEKTFEQFNVIYQQKGKGEKK